MNTLPTIDLVATLREEFGDNITRKQIVLWATANDCTEATVNYALRNYKTGRGVYDLSLDPTVNNSTENEFILPEYQPMQEENFSGGEVEVLSLIPSVDKTFIPFGNYKDVHSVIKSGIFYPAFITGLSGCGKTHGIDQACAKLKREIVRVNITIETDEDDLIGGMRLQSVATHTVKCDEYTYSKFLEWKNSR